MANICLLIGTKKAPDEIRAALTTLDGLNAWWTDNTTGDPGKGGTLNFRFGDFGGFDMKVIKSDDRHVHWKVEGGPEDWIGTTIEFEIKPVENQNQVLFRHAGWRSENPHFHHCSTKWATFLLSLKDYLETGRGRPFPDDVKIEAVGM